MKKFFLAHYEKMILAVLLLVFAGLLVNQLLFVQKAQTQYVDAKVDQKQPPTDYVPIDFAKNPDYKLETIFSEWNTVKLSEDSATATQMMSPYPMAECVFCHALIPSNAYPEIGETKNGTCPACGKALAPRIETDELAGKSDLNSNGIPDDWEKEFNVSAEMASPDSDEDSDGFNLLQEYKAKTNPTDPLSHPKYISQVYVSAISRQRFTGLELVSVDTTKPDKKDWQATFNVVRNNRKRSEFVKINSGTFKNNNVDFSVVDMEMDEKTQEAVVFIQRVGKQERIPCRSKQAVYDPMLRVRFLNALFDRTFIVSTGAEFKLGTAKTGEELYKLISVDPDTKEATVESVAETPETFKILPVPKDAASPAANDAGKTTVPPGTVLPENTKAGSPFLQKQ